MGCAEEEEEERLYLRSKRAIYFFFVNKGWTNKIVTVEARPPP